MREKRRDRLHSSTQLSSTDALKKNSSAATPYLSLNSSNNSAILPMSDSGYQDVQYGSKVMVGCGCRTVKDVVTFIRERRIEYVELAWGMSSC
jgi:hypothetical protein